ncbi:hypothetical protein HK096_010845, partial [Nowakowskiella sp. JEL0078]
MQLNKIVTGLLLQIFNLESFSVSFQPRKLFHESDISPDPTDKIALQTIKRYGLLWILLPNITLSHLYLAILANTYFLHFPDKLLGLAGPNNSERFNQVDY